MPNTITVILNDMDDRLHTDTWDVFDNICKVQLPPVTLTGGTETPISICGDENTPGEIVVTRRGGMPFTTSYLKDGDIINL